MRGKNKTITEKTNPVVMTENDWSKISEMLDKSMKTHSENVKQVLDAKFETLEVKLDAIDKNTTLQLTAIKEQTTKTNGRVTTNENDIIKLKENNTLHVVNCPNTAKITTIEQMEIGRKAVRKFAWSQLVIASAIIGLIIGVLQILFGK